MVRISLKSALYEIFTMDNNTAMTNENLFSLAPRYFNVDGLLELLERRE
jgi:hypothetical protein